MRYFSLCELGIHESVLAVRCMKTSCENPKCHSLRLENDYYNMYAYLPFSTENGEEVNSSESTYSESDYNLEDDIYISFCSGTKHKDICTHIISGFPDECVRSKCTFAHSIDTWDPEICVYGNRCNKMRVCRRLHPRDTKDNREKTLFNVLKRIGVHMDLYKKEPDLIIVEKSNKNTRVLCPNVRNKNICFDKECVKAHTKDEWEPGQCENPECADSKCEKKHGLEHSVETDEIEHSSANGDHERSSETYETVDDVCARLGIKLMSSKKYYRTKHFTMLARH